MGKSNRKNNREAEARQHIYEDHGRKVLIPSATWEQIHDWHVQEHYWHPLTIGHSHEGDES